jgi:hypothetical protein
MVEKPEVMVKCSSESVIRSTYGLTRQADSPWPILQSADQNSSRGV